MPKAVSDSSTLIQLSVLGRLGLLQEFYGHVLIPPAMWQEVVEEGQGRAGAHHCPLVCAPFVLSVASRFIDSRPRTGSVQGSILPLGLTLLNELRQDRTGQKRESPTV